MPNLSRPNHGSRSPESPCSVHKINGRSDISAEQFCLAPGKTYAVGRYPGPTPDSPDIGNKADNSMSRKHGVITVERGRRGGGGVRPKVYVEDSGSKVAIQ